MSPLIKNKRRNRNLSDHRRALDNLYENYDFSSSPWGYDGTYIDYTRDAIHRPVAEYLREGPILDTGGGYGFFRRYSGGRLHVNLDLSINILKHDQGSPKIIAAGEKLPFPDCCFANVVCVGVLRHLYNPEEYLKEAHRVLELGGRLLISTPAADWPGILNRTPWSALTFLSWLESILKSGRNTNSEDNTGGGVVYDRRYLPEELVELVSPLFEVKASGRSGKDFPSRLHPPRWMVEKFYDPSRYGRFLYLVAEKEKAEV